MVVSTLDYSQFTSETKEQREKFAHALLDNFERTGFAKLKGHAFSAQEPKELFTGVRVPTSVYLVVSATPTFLARPRRFLTSHWR